MRAARGGRWRARATFTFTFAFTFALSIVTLGAAALGAAPQTGASTRAPAVADTVEPTGSQQARVAGVVYDSVSHVTLSGALVQLVATTPGGAAVRLGTVTDSMGRFVFPSVDRGRFVIGFFHPKLDSLGVDVPLETLEVGDEGSVAVDLAVPSVSTVLHRACGTEATRDSSGALVGFVRSAATATALGGVEVRARWSEITIGAKVGARLLVRESTAHTGEDGWFVVCRVPAGGLVLVSAGDSGATLEMSIPDDGLLLRDLYVAAPPPSSSGVRGTIRDPYGTPIAGARVRLWGERREARSNAQGEFSLAGLPTGTRMLELQAIGYAPRRELVDLRSRGEVVVDLPLEEFPTTIDTIRVFGATDERDARLAGFARRQALGQGVFLGPQAVERRQPLSLTDLLRGISGVEVSQVRGARTALMRSPDGTTTCEPELFINGAHMPRYESSLDDLIPVSDVQAIEVYPRRIQAPAEYQSLTCGSVVIWTGARGWLAKGGRSGVRKP
ncbi:MAG: carboxypeptidase regulatory-like domain-containing protein [Gemmatimonadota bacterium]